MMSSLVWTAESIGVPRNVADPQAACLSGPVHVNGGIVVRSFRPEDSSAIRHLCCETGFLGNPVDPLFHDRELFADLFTKPYLRHEPDWTLVAEGEGRVIGYLLGSIRPDFDRILLRCGFQTVSKMVCRLMLGRYAGHRRTRQFIRWLLTAGFWEQPKHPKDAAHLHFNVHKTYRGRGVGRQLWIAFEQRLRAASVPRCYGAFFSHSKRQPAPAYSRFGFREFARCQTTMFKEEVRGPVDVVCVSKEF